MDSEKTGKNAKKKPFRWTKELVRLARNENWTQKEIADRCRTQQSIVSAWSKGTKLGTEDQLRPLLEVFGHKLRRMTFKVYWSFDPETNEKVFYRVEGKIILSLLFCNPRRDKSGKLIRELARHKLVIHHQGRDLFRVILQDRFAFERKDELLECSVEEGVWNSQVSKPMTIPELIDFVDTYADHQLKENPSDGNTLPFLIRQALLNHGFPVEGIEEFPAVW